MTLYSGDVTDFVAIGEVADATKKWLAMHLQTDMTPSQRPMARDRVALAILRQARDYLADVREGFVLSVRTGQVTDKSEIRYLLDRVLLDWDALSQELGLALAGEDEEALAQELELVRGQLLAFGMAIVALAALPRLPSEAVTFPHSYNRPPTYADIPAPVTPAEVLSRIEEMEGMLWQFAKGQWRDLVRRRYGPLRRTYGFFESSALLAGEQARRFGM
jgi:hypothetical protein